MIDIDPSKEIEILQVPLRLFLICSNVLVAIFAICGNTVAIIVASKSRLTSTPTRFCLLSLALSDLFLTASSAPLDLGQVVQCLHAWVFEPFLCKTLPFIQFLFLMANSFSLLAMVAQRLWSTAILLSAPRARPSLTVDCDENRAENQSLWSSIFCTIIIWLLSFGFSIPYYFAYDLQTRPCFLFLFQHNNSGDNNDDLSASILSKNGTIYCPQNHPPFENITITNNSCFNTTEGEGMPLPVQLNGGGGESKIMATVYQAQISICLGDTQSTASIYHVVTGLVFTLLSISLFLGYYYIVRGRRVEEEFVLSLPPTKLGNILLIQKIRQMLSVQRRGLRFIMWLIGIFILCRLPIWVFTIVTEQDVYSRSNQTLGTYFSLHLLANFKGAITPFLYASSSHMLQSNSRTIPGTGQDNGSSINSDNSMGDQQQQQTICCCYVTRYDLPYRRHSFNFIINDVN